MHRDNRVQLSALKEPHKIRLLILNQRRIAPQDFFFLRKFTNVIKMDLSYNRLHEFPSGFSFSVYPHIRILLLHYNRFNTLKNLTVITESHSLQYLTLFGNPLDESRTRHFFVNQVPTLMLMDDKVVTEQQRQPMLNDATVVYLPYPLVTVLQPDSPSSHFCAVVSELTLLRKQFRRANPVLVIQRGWRVVMRRRNDQIKKASLLLEQSTVLQSVPPQTPQLRTRNSITPVVMAHAAFWRGLQQTVGYKKMYATKDYCIEHNIKYEPQGKYLLLRKDEVDVQKMVRRAFLLRINYCIGSYLLRVKGREKRRIQRHITIKREKVQYDCEKYRECVKKLKKIEQRYVDGVVEIVLGTQEKMKLIKKQFLMSYREKREFKILFLPQISRIAAAVQIQRIWRGYNCRRKFNAFSFLQREYAARKIQKWVRNLRFDHRLRFLIQIRQVLRQNNCKYITLRLKDIPLISQISEQNQQRGHNFRIPFQQNSFQIQNSSQVQIVSDSHRVPSPLKYNLSIRCGILQYEGGSVMKMLLKNTLRVERGVDSEKNVCVRIHYRTLKQANSRMYVLGLKTYQMKTHSFIRGMNNGWRRLTTVTEDMMQNAAIEIVESNSTRLQECKSYALFENRSKQSLIDNSSSLPALLPHLAISNVFWQEQLRFYDRDVYYSCKLVVGHFAQIKTYTKPERYVAYKYAPRIQRYEMGFSTDNKERIRQPRITVDLIRKEEMRLQAKRNEIQEIKQKHKMNILQKSSEKERSLEIIRRSAEAKNVEMKKKCADIVAETIKCNKKRYNRIKETLTVSNNQFESKFVLKSQREMHMRERIIGREGMHRTEAVRVKNQKLEKKYIKDDTIVEEARKTLRKQVQNYRETEEEVKEKQRYDLMRKEKKDQQKREKIYKRDKKHKRVLIHSVFPEEYYPISKKSVLPKIQKEFNI